MNIASLRFTQFTFVLAALSACEAPITDQAAVYEALMDEVDGLDRTYYVRELHVPLGYPLEDRLPPGYLSEYAFLVEKSTHVAEDFGRVSVSFVSESDYMELFGSPGYGEGWNGFHERYPDAGSLIQLSQVGFSSRADQAVVSLSVGSDYLAATGGLYFLEKQSGQWVITKVEYSWQA